MDITGLLENAPELVQSLQGLGLDDPQIQGMAQEIGAQLSSGAGLDFTALLSGLNAETFLAQIDVAALAEKIGISAELAQSAVDLIAPAVANFDGGGVAGAVGNLAKGLFK